MEIKRISQHHNNSRSKEILPINNSYLVHLIRLVSSLKLLLTHLQSASKDKLIPIKAEVKPISNKYKQNNNMSD